MEQDSLSALVTTDTLSTQRAPPYALDMIRAANALASCMAIRHCEAQSDQSSEGGGQSSSSPSHSSKGSYPASYRWLSLSTYFSILFFSRTIASNSMTLARRTWMSFSFDQSFFGSFFCRSDSWI